MAGPSNIPPPMPPQYGAPPPFQQFPPQQSNPLKMVLIVGGVIFALMFLGGIAVGIFAVAILPGRRHTRIDLERRQMREVHAALERAEADPANQKKFAAMKDKAGRAFWNDCFREGVLDTALVGKIVCMGSASGDSKAESTLWANDPKAELQPENCSYTSPKASELSTVLKLKGGKRVVLFTLDSRNWRSYATKGVPCVWSDGECEWLTLEQAQTEYGIAQSQWNDPANELFGKKHPFEYTHEK